MARPVFGAVLLFALVNVSLPLRAQSVALDVCNAGKVDLDVFLLQSGRVSSSHIASADCATIAKTDGSMAPGYLGFAFADSQGQWGGARRFEFLPPGLGSELSERASQNTTVRHGNSSVPLTMSLLIKPQTPICRTITTPGPHFVADLPFGATSAQRSEARAADSGMAPASTTTVCDAFDYKMNVLTYPDSHEIRFNKFCDLCDKKTDAAITPEQRADARRRGAAANQVIGTLSGLGGLGAIFGAAIDQGKQAVAEEEREKERERHQDEFQRIGWHDMPEFIYRAFRDPGPGQKPVIQNIAVQGTIAGIKQPLPGAHELWTDVYFKESPDKHFDMCTSSPDIFRDIFGPDYATSMIGKTVEVSGELTRSSCQSGAGIRVSLGRQVHLVGSGRGMVATVEPTAIKFSEIAPPPPPQESLDPSMPNYYAPAGSFIAPYCRGIYDPALRLLTPDQIRVRNANQAAVQAEVQKCISSFDPTEVATHRKIAMRYCLGHNNYTTRGGATLAAYDDCMYQNDTLTALCTQELAYRTDLVDRSVYMQRPVPKCPAPRPNGREALVLLHGGHEDMGRPVVIPATGPGLPSPLEPGIMQRATASASAAKSPQAPAPAPVVPSAVPPPDPRVEPAARVRSAGRAPSASVPAASDLDNIIELVKGGMPEALVIRSIQRQGKTYNVTPEDLVKLRKAGVSQNIMSALLDPALSFQATPAPPPAAAPGRAAPQSPEDAQAGRQPQVADRRQRAEEYRACVQHAAKDNPQGGPEQEKAVTVCAQRLRAK